MSNTICWLQRLKCEDLFPFSYLKKCHLNVGFWTVGRTKQEIWRTHLQGIFCCFLTFYRLKNYEPINRCSPTVLLTHISCSSVDDDQLKLSAQAAILAHGQYETAHRAFSLATQLVWLSCGPELLCTRWWLPWASMVAPCVTLSCHALYNSQEEDLVPPRPPLPQSYEPNPPTVPPLPSRAGVRPSSLHRPEDRKANHRNGTHSVSSLTRWPHGWPCP